MDNLVWSTDLGGPQLFTRRPVYVHQIVSASPHFGYSFHFTNSESNFSSQSKTILKHSAEKGISGARNQHKKLFQGEKINAKPDSATYTGDNEGNKHVHEVRGDQGSGIGVQGELVKSYKRWQP